MSALSELRLNEKLPTFLLYEEFTSQVYFVMLEYPDGKYCSEPIRASSANDVFLFR